MSHTEHHKGKATYFPQLEGESMRDYYFRAINSPKILAKASWEDIRERIQDECEYLVEVNDHIFMLDNRELEETDDICEGTVKEDDSIEYEVKFYNGGASFTEMVERAIELAYRKKQ